MLSKELVGASIEEEAKVIYQSKVLAGHLHLMRRTKLLELMIAGYR